MAQQTAVEWLDRWFRDNPEATHEEGGKALQQAKQMEKEQHQNTWIDSRIEDLSEGSIRKEKSFEQYYNEIYGGQGSPDTP